MRNAHLTYVMLAAALAATAPPAAAAVTPRGANPDERSRAAWLERYSERQQGPEQTDKVSITQKVGTGGSLDLTHLSGDVRVTGGSGAEIRIDATKRVRHRDSGEARRLLDELRVDVNNFNGRVEVRTLYPRRSGSGGRGVSASVDYVISVPAGAAVAIKSISGDVAVSNVRGEVRAETVSGDVQISNTPNVTLAKTVSGDVTARDIGADATLVLSTVSGNVIGSGLKVRSLEAGTVSGDVRIGGSQVERLEAKSLSGDIEFDAPLTKGGRYQFTSHSGSVRVVISGSTGFEIDADTFSGSIRSDVPVTLRSVGRANGERRGSPRVVRGTYGDAGAILAVRSHSGSIVITRK